MTFRFNKSYDDLEQVAEFLPAFEAVLADLEAAGQYRYNDSFKGRIPGIEGPDEDTAIYLLQGLERKRRQDEAVARLLTEGYEHVDELKATTRFARVVLYPTRRMGGEWQEFEDARVLAENGKPYAVLRKRKRTWGTAIAGRRVLARR